MALLDAPRTLPDSGLVSRVRGGSDAAFEALYVRYFRRIRGFVAGRLADPSRAEDVTQDVFLSALRRLRATEQPVALEPWLFAIARNACIDEFRRHNRGARETELPEDLAELQDSARVPLPPDPPAAVDLRQQISDLRGALDALSADHHDLIVLRELEGLSYDEIAGRLGMSRPRVESSLFRARRKLGQEYAELVSGRRCASVQAVTSGGSSELRRLGTRERRVLGRHLVHCQPCRRAAHAAGVDESLLRPRRRISERVAAVLPLGWLRGRWLSRAAENAVPPDALHATGSAVAVAVAGLAAALGGVAAMPGPGAARPSQPTPVAVRSAPPPAGAAVSVPPPSPTPAAVSTTISAPAVVTRASLGARAAILSASARNTAPRNVRTTAGGPAAASRTPVAASRSLAPVPAPSGASAATDEAHSLVQPALAATASALPGTERQAVGDALGAVGSTVNSTEAAAGRLTGSATAAAGGGGGTLQPPPLARRLPGIAPASGH